MNLEQIVKNTIRDSYEEEEHRQREKEYSRAKGDTLAMRVCGSIILILAFLSTVNSLL